MNYPVVLLLTPCSPWPIQMSPESLGSRLLSLLSSSPSLQSLLFSFGYPLDASSDKSWQSMTGLRSLLWFVPRHDHDSTRPADTLQLTCCCFSAVMIESSYSLQSDCVHTPADIGFSDRRWRNGAASERPQFPRASRKNNKSRFTSDICSYIFHPY